jgi:DNA-directed RNA polymerase specialized sigma54-like protein
LHREVFNHYKPECKTDADPSETILTTIRTRYNTLSDVQKSIADYVLANSSQVILLSISDLAERCGTSETTITRFYGSSDIKATRFSGSR